MDKEKFPYRNLGSGEIRLLRFRRSFSRSARQHNLNFKIEHFPLHSAPPYVALSYCWVPARHRGDRSSSTTYSIQLEGHEFSIRENLFDALTHLAAPFGRRLIWIDAICINQEDLDERSRQVAIMKQIYDGAVEIFGWIGVPHDDEETGLAVALMKDLDRSWKAAMETSEQNDYEAFKSMPYHFLPHFQTPHQIAWNGMQKIFNNQYYTRTWVFQETAREIDDRVSFWHGNHSFSLLDMWSCHRIAFLFWQLVDPKQRLLQCFIAGATFEFASYHVQTELSTDLLSLLHAYRRTNATDPRDKVYAPRNSATDVSPSMLLPNYHKETKEVYKEVAVWSLSKPEHGLKILSYVFHESAPSDSPYSNLGLPSWIPDWSDTRCSIPSPRGSLTITGLQRRPYCPTSTNNASMTKVKEWMLEISGAQLDVITNMQHIWTDDDGPEGIKAWAPIEATAIYVPTGQTYDEAFNTVLVGDLQELYSSELGEVELDFKRGYMVDWELLTKSEDQTTSTESEKKETMKSDLYIACYMRRFCHTRNGYMGLIPAASEVGDIVVALFGGHVLYVLRHVSGEHYKFVGECYIHGLMDGEAFQRPQEEVPKTETFILV